MRSLPAHDYDLLPGAITDKNKNIAPIMHHLEELMHINQCNHGAYRFNNRASAAAKA